MKENRIQESEFRIQNEEVESRVYSFFSSGSWLLDSDSCFSSSLIPHPSAL
jgi:hypothetical protein